MSLILTCQPASSHHDSMLLVKMRQSVKPKKQKRSKRQDESPPSSGLQMVWAHEVVGLVKQITPLHHEARVGTNQRAPLTEGLMLSQEHLPSDHPLTDVHLIETTYNEAIPRLKEALESDANVESVSPVPRRRLGGASGTGNKKKKSAQQSPPKATGWNLKKISWPEAVNATTVKQAATVQVAILDTFVQSSHPDLKGQVNKAVHEYKKLKHSPNAKDIVGHGTHVSGILAAKDKNGIGINGLCNPRLMVYKIFGDAPEQVNSSMFEYTVDPVMYRRGLAACLDGGVQALNLSVAGTGKPEPTEQKLFEKLEAQGVTIVAAMGNQRLQGSPTLFPAALKEVIAVGATGVDDEYAYFSNAGDYISICAPGVGVWSTVPTYPGQTGFFAKSDGGETEPGAAISRARNYDSLSGTSMAAPHVTGAVALLLANDATLSPKDVRKQLEESADKVEGMKGAKFTPDYGYGRLNLNKLLAS